MRTSVDDGGLLESYYLFWGKADRVEEETSYYHLLPFHSLDVAAVGVAYLRQNASFLKFCCTLLNCSEEAFLSWAAFLLTLHDLGKFSEAFQALREDLVKLLQKREINQSKRYLERHDTLGFMLWREFLSTRIIQNISTQNSQRFQGSLAMWLRAVTGHHGVPPKNTNETIDLYFLEEDKQAAEDFVIAMADLLLTEEAKNIAANLDEREFYSASQILSWWFAGITVLADWLGSNTLFFPYQKEPIKLKAYWEQMQIQAKEALHKSGVLASSITAGQSLKDFFPYIQNASPLQEWAARVDIPQEPQIYLLEDVTGSGKTEAALMLAYRLMSQGLAQGFFVGLPTMATANAMYDRIADTYQKFFSENTSAVLAHGFKTLVEKFTGSILHGYDSEKEVFKSDETASARCAAWLADHSKRALLGSVAVGTIDQALLAVLHSKHQSVRLLGLFNKVLIVDEVHACDTYMQGILQVLLEFHARSGGSVILLSATLPSHMKQALLKAYAKGRQQATPSLSSTAYPLATSWCDGMASLSEETFPSRSSVSRSIGIHYEHEEEKNYAHIIQALEQGHCVGWIRNTVADAMSSYARLSKIIPPEKITLFHARFAIEDRLSIEKHVLNTFGSKSTSENRQGQLLIATQVVEQSLDLDFDELITDLAPIDRILQRAGRLHRHVRDSQGNRRDASEDADQRAAPCLWIYGPAWTEKPEADWYGKTFKKGQYVYAHHGYLWLTARVLQSQVLTMPDDARIWIETVFSEEEPFPEALEKNAMSAEGKEWADKSQAQQNTIKLVNGYQIDNINWWEDAKTPSRLGEETVDIMLAKWVNGKLEPWAEGALAYSTLKMAARQLATVDESSDHEKKQAYLRLQNSLPNQGKWYVLLPLSEQEKGVWQGQARTAEIGKRKKSELRTWLYDKKFGLREKGSDAVNAASD